MTPSTGLANSWPATGPKRQWTRALGEGHSSILVENGRLYTMYRPLGLLAAVRRGQEEPPPTYVRDRHTIAAYDLS